jgi:hypothetical protein
VTEAIELSSGCGSCFYAEILENSLKVLFHRARTDRENGPNVSIALADSQPLKHFKFSFCQSVCAWPRKTLMEEKKQSFIVLDKAHVEACALSATNQ